MCFSKIRKTCESCDALLYKKQYGLCTNCRQRVITEYKNKHCRLCVICNMPIYNKDNVHCDECRYRLSILAVTP